MEFLFNFKKIPIFHKIKIKKPEKKNHIKLKKREKSEQKAFSGVEDISDNTPRMPLNKQPTE